LKRPRGRYSRHKSIFSLRVTHGMNAYNTYYETQTNTADPGELVVMLYKGAARFLASAIEGIEAGNREVSNNNFLRAQAVISELTDTLDMARGGDLAMNLGRIYEYMNHRLVDANLRKDAEPAREVERLLRELLPAWEQAARETKAAQPVRKLMSLSA
jgi:flagellar protein FliS